MIQCIVGRTASGKDYLAKLLEEKDCKIVKSYSTRPKRSEDEDTHIFIKPEESANYPDKVAKTIINGNEYFATKEQVENSDVYIIDPKGLRELTTNMPDTAFHIIYVEADPMDRRIHAVKRADDKLKEENAFEKRDESENDQFSEFEDEIMQTGDNYQFPSNVTEIEKYLNKYDPEETERLATYLKSRIDLHKNLSKMIQNAVKHNIIKTDEKTNKILFKKDDTDTSTVSNDIFVDILIGNPYEMHHFSLAYLSKLPIS